jgi:hypothetical protein
MPGATKHTSYLNGYGPWELLAFFFLITRGGGSAAIRLICGTNSGFSVRGPAQLVGHPGDHWRHRGSRVPDGKVTVVSSADAESRYLHKEN